MSEKTWNPNSGEPYGPTSSGLGATPIFEYVFYDNSFGFRPHPGAQDAIAKVVDLDLKAYFDNVNHDLIIKCLQQYITDPWTLRFIHKFLTSAILDYGIFARNDRGTPQGGSLSSLLANAYLNELDKELTKRGRHFVRYEDDCNIYVKSQQAGERVKQALKLLTKCNRGVSLTKIFEEIHQKMRGWLQYYSIGKLTGFIHRLD